MSKGLRSDIPKPTVARLPHYRRALEYLLSMGATVISSHDLAREAEVTPSQLRKDLAYFGQFGTAGIGYDVRELISRLDDILGMSLKRPVLLVGMGNLGRAVLNHLPSYRSGFEIVAAADVSESKTGRVISGVRCHHIAEIANLVETLNIEIAVLTVPVESAQQAATALVSAGIRAIVNFTPARLRVPESVVVEQVDLSLTLQKVSFYLEPTEEEK